MDISRSPKAVFFKAEKPTTNRRGGATLPLQERRETYEMDIGRTEEEGIEAD
jgi:hypothetical protein